VLYIANAQLVTDGQPPVSRSVLLDDGRIALIAPATQTPPAGVAILDGTGLYLAPGFIDLQLNGGFGEDFTANPASIWPVATRLPQFGVTAFLPTIISSPPSSIAAAKAAWRRHPPPDQRGAVPLGLHVEGPFINPHKRGAHNPAHLRLPDVTAVAGWTRETGVWLVTLAPELPHALDTIRALRAQGGRLRCGHTLRHARVQRDGATRSSRARARGSTAG
jgi:N-acetylglucosamine-6-phosphate deacetylase